MEKPKSFAYIIFCLTICLAFAVGSVLLMLRKIHASENNMVMAILFVDVSSNDILILAAEDFIAKLPPDPVGLRVTDLSRRN